MRHRALLGGLLLVGACFRSGDTAATPGNSVAATPEVNAYAATLADPLGFLPIDSELVLGLDVDQIRASDLWKIFEHRIAAMGELAQFKEACGFDPVTSIRAATMGFMHLDDDTRIEGVMVIRGVDRTRVMACAEQMQAKGSAVVVSDGVVSLQRSASSVAWTFVDDSTLLAHLGRDATQQSLLAIRDKGVSLRGSPAFVAMVDAVDLEATVWGAVNGSSKVFDQATAGGIRAKAVFGSLRLATGLSANVHIRLDSAQQAQSLATLIEGQLGMVKSSFDRLDITAEETDVVVAAAMTDDQLRKLINLVGVMFGPGAAAPPPPPAP